jgi:hypothetical protein
LNSANFAAIVGLPLVSFLTVKLSALLLARRRLFSEPSMSDAFNPNTQSYPLLRRPAVSIAIQNLDLHTLHAQPSFLSKDERAGVLC